VTNSIWRKFLQTWNPLPSAVRVRRSVRAKLMRVVLTTTAIALCVAGAAMLSHDLIVYRHSLALNLSNEASMLALSTAPALAIDDRKAAENALMTLHTRPQVSIAALYAADGTLYASYSSAGGGTAPERLPSVSGVVVFGQRVELTQPLVRGGQVLGTIYLRAEYRIADRAEAYVGIFALVLLLSLTVAYAFSRQLQTVITEPLEAMTLVARKIVDRRDYGLRAKKTTDDEIGLVVDAFNSMLDEVQSQTRALEQSNAALQEEVRVRQAAEQALRASEKVYRAIGESLDYGVWICAPDGRNVYISESFLRLMGATQEQCADFGWLTRLHADDAAATSAAWRECVATGGVWYRELRVLGIDGLYHPILAQGVPVRGEDGEISGWAGINLDISRLKQTEEALREADRRKDEFLATLAHELRNPLAPIRHAVRLLESQAADAQQQGWAREVITRQVQRMALLLDDLLDVSRITRGRLDLKIDVVKLESLVGTAVETARPLIDAKQQHLAIHLPEQSFALSVDPLRLSQSLSNLLTNAAKYTDTGGHIALTVSLSPLEIIFSVTDTGVGLEPDAIAGLFEMFSQGHTVIDRAEGGLGIGLALVKGLITLHGGTVQASSSGVGQGSEFRICLPRSMVVDQIAEVPVAGGLERAASGPRNLVLVADDNQDAAQSMAMVLEIDGYEVLVAHSGEDAFRMAQVQRPHAAILDIGMPDMTGYELARRLRSEPWGQSLLLIAITGWGQQEDKERAKAAGFDRHFTKPVDPDELEQALQALLGKPHSG
jgi:PAS domain S-box-containing protein